MKKIVYPILLVLFLCFITSCNNKGEEKKLVISVNAGVDTVEVFDNFVDKGARATYGNELVAVKVTSNVDTTTIGTYEVTYEATYNDQTVKAVRKVSVVDQTAPIISLSPGVDTIKVGETWVDCGVITTDNSMGTVTVTVDGTVDSTKAGEYVIAYKAVDSSGNESSAVRYVNVVE